MKFKWLLVLALSCAIPVHATQVTLVPNQDNTIFQDNQSNSDGGALGFFVGTNNATTPAPRRALISFDLSSIPSYATITGVQLTLTLAMTPSGGPGHATIGLFDLTQSWGEGSTNQGLGLAGNGNGGAAGTGDATWLDAHYSTTSPTTWTAAGGDHASSASASLALTGTTVGTPYTWLSTPQLVADLQGWLATPSTNYGWELINADETDAKTFYAFNSREASSGQPQLQITYTVPEPGTFALLAGAPLFWLARRRRGHAACLRS